MPHQEIQFGGLSALVAEERVPMERALDASDCELDDATIRSRHGYRRSAANALTESNFGNPPVAGYRIWFKSDTDTYQDSLFATPALASDAPVGGWKDQSGNNYHLLQATGGKRPLLKLAQINGYPGVRFDHTDDFMQCVDFTWAQPVHLFFACAQYDNNASGGRVLASGGVTGGVVQFFCNAVDGRYSAHAGSGAINADDYAGGSPNHGYAVVEALFNGITSRIKINNNTTISANIGANAFGGFTLGAYNDGTTPAYLDVAEVIGYPTELSTGNATLVRNYLNAKYVIF